MKPSETASVRPLGPADIPAVAALEALCNPQPWGADAVSEFSQPVDSKHIKGKSGGSVKVGRAAVREDGLVIGYALATALGAEAEIMVLGVHPEARRGGVGRAVLRDLLDALRGLGVTSVFLEVRRGNKPAVALYRTLGFGEAGLRKGYYADTGEDALLLHVFMKS